MRELAKMSGAARPVQAQQQAPAPLKQRRPSRLDQWNAGGVNGSGATKSASAEGEGDEGEEEDEEFFARRRGFSEAGGVVAAARGGGRESIHWGLLSDVIKADQIAIKVHHIHIFFIATQRKMYIILSLRCICLIANRSKCVCRHLPLLTRFTSQTLQSPLD